MNEFDQSAIRSREKWTIPFAILAAGAILAIAIFYIRHTEASGTPEADITKLAPIAANDHILGSPVAPVVLIEYADIDSSYSKGFQSTMEQLMTDYAPSGKVAWVYRHLPLVDQHPYALQHAAAAECISSLGGPTIFWRFIDALNSAAPNDQQFDPSNYDAVVSSLGILPQSFDDCLKSNKFQDKVEADFKNGLAIGAGGSPFSVLLVKGKSPVTIDGSVPYAGMKKILDEAIKQADAAPAS